MKIVEIIRGTRLFDGIGEATLGSIAGHARRIECLEGDSVYEIGDDANDLYVVEQGRARFSVGVQNRSGEAGSIMTEGQVFGWAALLEEQPRRVATVVCLEPCLLVVIPGYEIVELFKGDTASGFVVMRRLATMITRDLFSVVGV